MAVAPGVPTRAMLETLGALVSTVTASDGEWAEVLDAASVAVAVTLCDPSLRVLLAMVQLPPVAVVVPKSVAPSYSVTVLPASAVPVKTGVVLLVILSVLLMPVSVPLVMSGVEGALGATVSVTMMANALSRLLL